MAGESFHIGPPPAAQSYLDSERILEIAGLSNADGVHPGYGFLSENAGFSEACHAQGVSFIGPPASAIRAMGSKSTSKAIMIEAGVPVTPGYHGEDQSVERLIEEAKLIQFPVLIKATLGGGGKGMRLVERAEDFVEMLDACKREALKSFGDDSVLLERFVTQPRHVEFQVFGDQLGNVVHLHERDCSVQRRHQKVLEESPAPGLTWDARHAMGRAAVDAAKAVGYVGAGTVEFLVDSKTGDYFFCEMNTRLQVEHPVTEMVTGLDLVEWQLAVASGQPLPITDQGAIDDRLRHPKAGHAIEARVYAENPLKEFLPATGKLLRLRQPASPPPREFLVGESDPRTFSDQGAGAADVTVRVDTGVRQGDEVTMFYDPMISKLIVHASDRPRALKALSAALKSYQVAGLPTNLSFLQRCVSHPAFQQGQVTTSFLEEHGAELLAAEAKPAPPLAKALAAVASLLADKETASRVGSSQHALASSSSPSTDPFYTAGAGAGAGAGGGGGGMKSWRAFGSAQSSSLSLVDNNAEGGLKAAKEGGGVTVVEHRSGVLEVTVGSAVAGAGAAADVVFKLRAGLVDKAVPGRMAVDLLPDQNQEEGPGMHERRFSVDTFVGSSSAGAGGGGGGMKSWRAFGSAQSSTLSLVDNNAEGGLKAAKEGGGVTVVEHRSGVLEVTVGSAVAGAGAAADVVFKLRAGLVDKAVPGRMAVDLLPDQNQEEGPGMHERGFSVDTFVGSGSGGGGQTVQLWAVSGDTLVAPPLGWDRQMYSFTLPALDVSSKARGAGAGDKQVRAPMPGKVLRVAVKPGDHVKEGQPLLILEAMKMEHVVVSPRHGVVQEVHCSEGSIVSDGSVLAELEELEESKTEEATTGLVA
eukprot:CAMPEP_0171988482 /NCGR_PEP_ID=MMETSP0993-20121228/275926_1 /TAXON_ID=483369 /ORGANISM="non described non described, Strain CCMP2098" /LENGTH=867 /DNA_ID=CAMNT_0012641457 /DNA_START=188 /DNA_END=2791 /DNA_ORIENTATION=+